MRSRGKIMRSLVLFALSACTAAEQPATFSEVYEEILSLSCGFSSCHGGTAGAPYLNTNQEAYESLVEVESNAKDGAVLVIPDDPDNSYLIRKMEAASDIEGDPMPPSSPLDPEVIERVRSWIADGAQQN